MNSYLSRIGEFKCEASDGTSKDTLSARVTVKSPPKTLLSPMTVTVRQGESVFVTCLCEETIHDRFYYKWTKDGKTMRHPRDQELVEDLYPAGSRLIIDRAESSATYRCSITSTYGSSSAECTVTVLNETGE